MKERRAHPRYPVGECGKLKPLEWESLIGQRDVKVVNVSDGGLGLQLDHSIPVGIAVRVLVGKGSYLGKIAYCRASGNAFVAGVAVQSGTAGIPRRTAEGKKPAEATAQKAS
jgi:hypothetical protein